MDNNSIFDSAAGFLISVLAASVTFFLPAKGLVALIISASLVDHFFGIWRVIVKKEKFSIWKGAVQTLSKIVAYTVIIGIAFIFDQNLINEISIRTLSTVNVVSKIVTLALCLNEWKSINRHFKAIKGVSIWDRLMEGLAGARKVIEEGVKTKEILFFAMVFLIGCTTSKNAIKRHNRLVENFPFVHEQDTALINTVFEFELKGIDYTKLTRFRDSLRDTIKLEDGLFVINTITSDGNGQSALKTDVMRQSKTITIIKEIKVPIVYYPKPVKWWEKLPIIFGFILGAFGIGYYLGIKK